MVSRRRFGSIEVELSNLDKVLYPATGTTKGEVIDYFTAIAPALLPHIAGRPVTRKRWPNGVDEPSFFEKNLATHAPKWIQRHTVEHSDRRVTYPVIDTVAGMAWLGQQASLEIHVPQWRFVDGERGPVTRLVFDLDPGPGVELADCAQVALWIRDTVRDAGLDAYPVTSGSKGIHVYVPLDRVLSPGGASTVAKQVATGLEKLHPELVTATMSKAARPGKIFLDWSQNNPSKTTIAPYSLRGRTYPTVAAPRNWEEIEDRKRLRHLTFDEALDRWRDHGDVLSGLDPPLGEQISDPLTTYRSMRDPARTPEPVPAGPPAESSGDRFVIQEHHARRLHWDVRLERGGVLVSWAVPKGPPTSPSENRLAVHTEDHPLEYLEFHGAIPKGEYGAGEMTIWDSGTYETEKWREDEVIVRLHGSRVEGRFAFIQTNGNQWLMHLMKSETPAAPPIPSDKPRQPAQFPHGLTPMLATTGDVSTLDGEEWVFETKWDGFRLIAEIEGGTVTLRSRAGNTVTGRYPRLAALGRELSGHDVVLDGEAVVFDDHGVANLGLLQADAARAVFVAFDVLYLDGTSLVRKRFSDRRRVLEALAGRAPSLVVPPQLDGPGAQALRYSQEHDMEGVVAKRKDSVYLPGRRGQSWVKTRNWRTQQVVVGGYRRSDARQFASLLVGVHHEGRLFYVGRVGTGFSEQEMAELATQLHRLERKTSPFENELTPEERKDAVWASPKVIGTVRYMNWTESGRMWHPAWIPATD
ncbi:ATP-dependent DNA ligase [Nocardia mexicana]|uniref:DNA ligase (ATP) n=1 Tax=Nocardia mexicana TaxID=279262 RepID=A0A370GKG9_9NOCA|nr:ATP-dependent DNA ligase [Nocardia mexicana]RDI43726.1 ATP-dependent DNA ligase LigD ligase module /ATP-dependent DNA ligase LigD phosphoesterase module /ATP-dependent DNA ligase LigD polymerase module [Nocardia mexicana]